MNLLGQLYQHYDESGRVTVRSVDFKGNPLDKVREVVADDQLTGAAPFVMDWQVPAGSTLAVHAASLLDADTTFETTVTYNALNQVISTTTPETVDGHRHEVRPSYDRPARSLLSRSTAYLRRTRGLQCAPSI